MNTTRLYAAAVAFLLVAPMSLVSHAQKASAQATFAKAFDAYQAFDCEQALRLFAKGVAQSPDPKAYYFMGNCERWRLNRAGAEAAYDSGLKLAPEGSPVRADLESAKASLAVAFDPALQTKLFYEAAQRMGIELPEGLQAATDPRLVPVHLDWEWEINISSHSQSSCPYHSEDIPSRRTGGITTSSVVARCYEPPPDKSMVFNNIYGFGLNASNADRKWDRKDPTQKGKTQYRDTTGWKYARTISYSSSTITPPQTGWIEYQETTTTTLPDHDNKNESSVHIARCQYKPSTNAEIRRLSDGPQLEVLCAGRLNASSASPTAYQQTYYIDLVSGEALDDSSKGIGVETARQVSGHVGQVGDTLTRVETRQYTAGSPPSTGTIRLTRTR